MQKQNRNQRGFTIMELMAVIIIIGLLAAMVAKNFMGQTDKARIITTKASLKSLHSAVQSFKLDTGRFPTQEEGLKSLIEAPADVTGYPQGGYLETRQIPKDAWSHDFVYILNPENGAPFEIISYGADGQEGGEGYNADLRSTDAD